MEEKRKRVKMAKTLGRDFLTGLPEPLIQHILSYLTMMDVVRTSVLSKSWRYRWLSVSSLTFSPSKMSRRREVDFINHCLLLHNAPNVEKLNITCKYILSDACQFDSWIHFALTRNVHKLSIDTPRTRRTLLARYILPPFLFSSRSLRVLALKSCALKVPDKFEFSYLKILSLEEVYLIGGAINELISSSPILELLSLINCEYGDNLDLFIFNVRLKRLRIHETSFWPQSSRLKVYAPFISSFELVAEVYWKNYVMERMRSLESAHFDCRFYVDDKEFEFVKILNSICHVKNLELGSSYIEALSVRANQSLDLPCYDVIRLQIKTGLRKTELPGIAYILRHSPHIETLVICIGKLKKQWGISFEEGDYWKLQEPNFKGLLGNLKTVKIFNFMTNLNVLQSKHKSAVAEELLEQLQNEVNFLRFLLKNSKALERMIITTCKKVNFGKSESKKLKVMFLLTQELLAYPRASPDAEISFK